MFVRILFVFNSCYVILIEWAFCYLFIYNVWSRLLALIVLSIYFFLNHEIQHYYSRQLWFVDYDNCNYFFLSLKLENELKKRVWNVTGIKNRFLTFDVIFLLSIQDAIKCFFLILVMQQDKKLLLHGCSKNLSFKSASIHKF